MEHSEVHKKFKEQNSNNDTTENIKREISFKFSLFIFLALAAIFIAAAFVAALFVIKEGQHFETLETQIRPPDPEVYSANSPFPFQELTIPYLRSRRYESKMSELEQLTSGSNYTSYLTSYTSDGLKVNGLLTEPSGQAPAGGFPAIIFVHGYIPPASYVTTSNYASYVDYLARNGFVVFKIDLRGHGNSEGDANGAYYSSDYIIDVLSAREALRGLDFVDPERIGLWGHSMAGNVALRSFVAAQDIPALSIWAGAVFTYDDWQELGLNDNSYRPPGMSSERQRKREELFAAHGEFNSNSDFWKMVVPTNYLEGLTGAIQLNHAVNDDVVNVGYSRGLDAILKNANIKSEFNEYESGGHNITGSVFTQAMQDTVRFFKENL